MTLKPNVVKKPCSVENCHGTMKLKWMGRPLGHATHAVTVSRTPRENQTETLPRTVV